MLIEAAKKEAAKGGDLSVGLTCVGKWVATNDIEELWIRIAPFLDEETEDLIRQYIRTFPCPPDYA
jgi:hypothetical protein